MQKMNGKEIIQQLPYSEPFLFVDELIHVDENGVEGAYTFNKDADFYRGHFKNSPVTPGVILTECAAQIGLVALGIYLLSSNKEIMNTDLQIGLSSSEMEFYEPVFPSERVTVSSEKIYFRFQKLKCKVKMHNSAGKLVCKGVIAGMFKRNQDG